MAVKWAKAARIVFLPPIMAIALFSIFYGLGRISLTAWILGVVCIGVLPSVGYFCTRDRNKQRKIAFILSGFGYVAGWVLATVLKFNQEAMLIFTTYLFTVFALLFFNKLLKIHASGHASGIAGPLIIVACVVDSWSVIPCVLLYAASFWSSVRLKRHTVKEFLLGTLCVMVSMGIAYLIYM